MTRRTAAVAHLGEEIANSITHGVGLGLAIAGLTVMVVFAAMRHSAWAVTGCSIYGATLVLLYLASTLYHALPGHTTKRIFAVFDHCAIYLLIAGTYTPFVFVAMRSPLGWTLFGVVWAMAIGGIVLRAVSHSGHEVIRTLLYIGMGWAAMAGAIPLWHALTPRGFAWLLSGGLCYTIGVLFFAWPRRYFHAIWHIFVLGGSICHYFAILLFVVMKH